VPIIVDNTLNQIRAISMGGDDRAEKAKRLAELIRKLGDYRWVGVYDVGKENVSLVAWSGPETPAHLSAPVTAGLAGAAIREKRALIAGDVRSDPRCLPALETTLSEIIVPVLSPTGGQVIGTVGVESDHLDSFSGRDQQMIEQCTQAALPLWLLR